MKETKGNFIKISEIINRSQLFLDQDFLSSIISLKHFDSNNVSKRYNCEMGVSKTPNSGLCLVVIIIIIVFFSVVYFVFFFWIAFRCLFPLQTERQT